MVGLPLTSFGSSHREAPFIAKNPRVDGTDFYMFDSYESGRAGYVTILANYIGLEDPAGGPNFFDMDPDALYEIHIDNDYDAKEDLTFQFQFQTTLASNTGFELPIGSGSAAKTVAIPLINAGGISATDESARNVTQTYTVNLVRGDRRTGSASPIQPVGATGPFKRPLDNIGEKTFGLAKTGVGATGSASQTYANYAPTFITSIDLPGCTPTGVPAGTHARVFVGQRREGFAVNLGQIFDLVDLKPVGGANAGNAVGSADQGLNTLANKNVTTIALEVPASCLTKDSNHPIIGGWTTSSVRQARVINPTPTFTQPTREGGAFAQVSRLGMPLVNEIIIGLKDKNLFNSSEPKDDTQFIDYVTNPTLPLLLQIVEPGVLTAPTLFPRADLVTAFLEGVPNVNATVTTSGGTTTGTPAEYLRLNTAVAPSAPANRNVLGALTCFDPATATAGAKLDTGKSGCNPDGFPNGRRVFDDVVDIELRVAMGVLLDTTDAPSGPAPLVDGAVNQPSAFLETFPYLASPIGGSP